MPDKKIPDEVETVETVEDEATKKKYSGKKQPAAESKKVKAVCKRGVMLSNERGLPRRYIFGDTIEVTPEEKKALIQQKIVCKDADEEKKVLGKRASVEKKKKVNTKIDLDDDDDDE